MEAVLPNAMLRKRKICLISSGKNFFMLWKIQNFTRFSSASLFCHKVVSNSDFQDLVAHFTIWQHCCCIFQCLVIKLFKLFPPIANSMQSSRPCCTQNSICYTFQLLCNNVNLLHGKFHETLISWRTKRMVTFCSRDPLVRNSIESPQLSTKWSKASLALNLLGTTGLNPSSNSPRHGIALTAVSSQIGDVTTFHRNQIEANG